MYGPGKYDDACTVARLLSGGSVILLVLEGNRGSGFSVQTVPELLPRLPELLEALAQQIRADQEPLKTPPGVKSGQEAT